MTEVCIAGGSGWDVVVIIMLGVGIIWFGWQNVRLHIRVDQLQKESPPNQPKDIDDATQPKVFPAGPKQ